MKVTRSEFVEGFKILGFVGLLIGAFVVPGQWASVAIRSEAVVGIVASTVCVLAAALLALSIKPAVAVASQLLLVVGVGYLALVPFIVVEVGWHYWQCICLVALVSATGAFVGWYGLRRIRQPGAQHDVRAGGL